MADGTSFLGWFAGGLDPSQVSSGAASLVVLKVPSELGVCPVTGTLSFLVFYVFSLHKFYLLTGERCKHFKELLAILAFRQCLILSWHIYSICVRVSDSYLPLQKFDRSRKSYKNGKSVNLRNQLPPMNLKRKKHVNITKST